MAKHGAITAEELNFWKTGKSSPDKWIELTKKQILTLGGSNIVEGFGSDAGKAAYMIGFQLAGEGFNIVWPIVKSKSGNERAERVQAATMLYHYVKGVALYSVIVGSRAAFFSHLLLSDGRTANHLATPELVNGLPKLLIGSS